RLQLQARRAVEDRLGGAYRSVFKGSGIAFEEVREYQPGDDIRSIDWNVTARMGHPFVKRFIEERELTVMLIVDFSASQDFGTQATTKRAVAAEIGALIAACALNNNDKVGLVALSDRVEKFVPPRKGTRHALRLLRDLWLFEPTRTGTSLRVGLDFVNRILRRRAIVFLISDFHDQGYDKALRRAARRHDVIAVFCEDVFETELPAVGLLSVRDAETGATLLVDSSDPEVQAAYRHAALARTNAVRQAVGAAQADWLAVSTAGDHVDSLVRFFALRQRRMGHR
ncbi:MAG: DUF58 domain-containing protein, partial [Gemmataceae bacterium]|nr:DUF58 domain-containing protein [Gemmataceae bacterium]